MVHTYRFIIVLISILRLADLIEQHSTALVNIEVLDSGKPLAEAKSDIQCAIDALRYYAGWCDKIHGTTIPAGAYVSHFLHENWSSKEIFFKIKTLFSNPLSL